MAPIDVVVPQPSTSPRPPKTPPSSPHLRAREQALNSEHVQLFVDLLKAAQSIQSAPAVAGPIQPATTGEIFGDKKTPRARASKVDFKTVNEVLIPIDNREELPDREKVPVIVRAHRNQVGRLAAAAVSVIQGYPTFIVSETICWMCATIRETKPYDDSANDQMLKSATYIR